MWVEYVRSSRQFLVTIVVSAVIGLLIVVSIGIGRAHGPEHEDVLPPPPSSAEGQQDLFLPGSSWDGEGTQGISQKDAEKFADYPLLWLGESFAGFNLQAIVHQKYQPPAPIPAYEAVDSMTFLYGDCVIPEGGEACPVPVVVAIEPVCATRPEWIDTGVVAAPLEAVDGKAHVLRFRDGHLRVWTGEISIYIDAPANPSLVDQIMDELRGISEEVGIGNEKLSSPDFSHCPPLEAGPALESPG